MNTYLIALLAAVLATALAIFLLGYQCGCARTEGRYEAAAAAARRDRPDERPVPYRLTRAGLLADAAWSGTRYASWSGAADPAYEARDPARGWQPFDLPSVMTQALPRITDRAADIARIERMTEWWEAEREVDAIWADIEAHPERWQSR